MINTHIRLASFACAVLTVAAPLPLAIKHPSAPLHIAVVDAANGRPIPCRITITDSSGRLTAFTAAASPSLAIRTGVVYTASGTADVTLAPGRYTIYATRGSEY